MTSAKKETSADHIRRHTRQLMRELQVIRSFYLDSGYTVAQCHVLFELSAHNSLNLGALAENLLLDKSNTSRTVKKLVQEGLVEARKVASDNRQKRFELTSKGKQVLRSVVRMADQQVEDALANLSVQQQAEAMHGMKLYANALTHSRLQAGYKVRPIQARDNAKLARVMRQVMTEYGARGEGYSDDDAEIEDMHGNYSGEKSCYYVVTRVNQVMGGAGFGPLLEGEPSTCEIRKMFLLPEVRGIGLGRRLLWQNIHEAKRLGYRQCYLETLDRMAAANALYQKCGFRPLKNPLGSTGHFRCDKWYLLEL